MSSLIDKLLSFKSDVQLKGLAISIFGGIALLVLSPCYLKGISDVTSNQFFITSLSIFGIIIVILSDRIVALNISKDKLNITLAELKSDVKETIDIVREDLREKASQVSPTSDFDMSNIHEKLSDLENVVTKERGKETVEELLADARAIGQVMGTLREIMKSYREFDK